MKQLINKLGFLFIVAIVTQGCTTAQEWDAFARGMGQVSADNDAFYQQRQPTPRQQYQQQQVCRTVEIPNQNPTVFNQGQKQYRVVCQ